MTPESATPVYFGLPPSEAHIYDGWGDAEGRPCACHGVVQPPPRPAVYAARPWALEWMTERSGYTPAADVRGIAATFRGRILGVVAFDGFTETIAQVHVALETPRAAGCLFRPAFRYAFHQTNRLALVTMVDSRNAQASSLAEGLGFREVGRIRDGVAMGADMILFEMRREDCRFLEAHRHGHSSSSSLLRREEAERGHPQDP